MDFAFERVDNVFVLAHTPKAPSDEEWKSYLDAMAKMPDLKRMRTLVYTEGGGPTSEQRKGLQETIKSHGGMHRAAVLTPSTMVRGIVTAISWFNREIKAFGPTEFPRAYGYLECSAEQQKLLNQAVAKVREAIHAQIRKSA